MSGGFSLFDFCRDATPDHVASRNIVFPDLSQQASSVTSSDHSLTLQAQCPCLMPIKESEIV